ncbi:hypothetical protein POPTR_012G017950v4 [Populus trichocarpa]|nr:hypothetical protein POPTR_012G017950v4 [Populus trichocarpa]
MRSHACFTSSSIFLPGFSIKSLDVLLHGSVRLILRPLAGPLFCLYMYVPLSAIAWITVHALKFVLCAVSMVLCDFFPCSATLLIIQVCYFMVSACGLTEVIGALYGLHAYFRLLFWATTDMLMCLLLAAIKAVCFHFYNCVIARCLLGSPNILPMACVTYLD